MIPSFRRGLHHRQSEVIVEEGMGPNDEMVKEALGRMSKQGAKRRSEQIARGKSERSERGTCGNS